MKIKIVEFEVSVRSKKLGTRRKVSIFNFEIHFLDVPMTKIILWQKQRNSGQTKLWKNVFNEIDRH